MDKFYRDRLLRKARRQQMLIVFLAICVVLIFLGFVSEKFFPV